MKYLLFPLLLILLAQACDAEGILAYKSQKFHADKDAKLVQFDSIEPQGFVTWVVVEGKRLRFERTTYHTWIELPAELPQTIVTKHEKASLAKIFGEISEFRKRFPRSVEASEGSFQLLKEANKKIQSGHVRKLAKWLSEDEYEEVLEKSKDAEMAAQERLEKAKAQRMRLAELALEEQNRKIRAEEAAIQNRRSQAVNKVRETISELEKTNLEIELKISDLFSKMQTLAIKHN